MQVVVVYTEHKIGGILRKVPISVSFAPFNRSILRGKIEEGGAPPIRSHLHIYPYAVQIRNFFAIWWRCAYIAPGLTRKTA